MVQRGRNILRAKNLPSLVIAPLILETRQTVPRWEFGNPWCNQNSVVQLALLAQSDLSLPPLSGASHCGPHGGHLPGLQGQEGARHRAGAGGSKVTLRGVEVYQVHP